MKEPLLICAVMFLGFMTAKMYDCIESDDLKRQAEIETRNAIIEQMKSN